MILVILIEIPGEIRSLHNVPQERNITAFILNSGISTTNI